MENRIKNKQLILLVKFKMLGGELLYGMNHDSPVVINTPKLFKYKVGMFKGVSKKLFDKI